MNLGEMYGPLPLGAWLGVVGGGLGLAFLSNRHQAAAVTPAAPVLPAGEIDAVDNSGGPTIGSSLPPTTQVVMPQSNSDWQTAIATQLVAAGNDPLTVQQALANFLNGDPLDDAEAAVIRKALRISQPPQGAPPIVLASATVPSSPPPAPGNTGGGVITPPPPPIPTTPAVHVYTTQEVRDLYARYGFVTLDQIGAATTVPTGESGADRVARNVRELNDGSRTFAGLEASIRILPHSSAAPATTTATPAPNPLPSNIGGPQGLSNPGGLAPNTPNLTGQFGGGIAAALNNVVLSGQQLTFGPDTGGLQAAIASARGALGINNPPPIFIGGRSL